MKTSKNSQSRGFTIIELMVVAIMIGILAGIGMGHYQRNWKEERLKAIARETAVWLEDARLRALQQSETCVIEIDDAKTTLKAASSDNGNDCIDIQPIDLKSIIQNTNNLILCSDTSTSRNLICNSSHTNSQNDETTKIIITPRGTVAQGGLIKLNLDPSIKSRCISITQPLGIIRQGIEKSSNCNFSTAY